MPTSPLRVTIEGVSKAYGKTRALDDIGLEVGAGEFVTLLGPSGSGKTTLMMAIAGFLRPDCGSVRFDGKEMIHAPPHRRNVGLVFQNYALFPHMSVLENVAYPLRQRRVGRRECGERAASALETVRLAGFGARRVDQLSGGQRQRVALARAIVFEPRLLLMDEPLSALDRKLRDQMQLELRTLHARLRVTTIYVTHDQREALTMADRVAVMRGGRIEQVDPPRRLYERPRTRFIADFVGESSFVPVELRDGAAWMNGTRVLTADPLPSAKRACLVARPEKLTLRPDPADRSINQLSGIVEEQVFQGDSLLLQIRLADGTRLIARHATRRELLAALPSTGQPITVGLHPDDTILVAEDE